MIIARPFGDREELFDAENEPRSKQSGIQLSILNESKRGRKCADSCRIAQFADFQCFVQQRLAENFVGIDIERRPLRRFVQ